MIVAAARLFVTLCFAMTFPFSDCLPHHSGVPSTRGLSLADIRRFPVDFVARIALLSSLGKGKSPSARADGDQSRRLTAPSAQARPAGACIEMHFSCHRWPLLVSRATHAGAGGARSRGDQRQDASEYLVAATPRPAPARPAPRSAQTCRAFPRHCPCLAEAGAHNRSAMGCADRPNATPNSNRVGAGPL
jgi:hypothetical protein